MGVCRVHVRPERCHDLPDRLGLYQRNNSAARPLRCGPRDLALRLALWFHDAIYDPRAVDSEEQSAAWAGQSLTTAGASSGQAERVSGLILSTKHASSQGSADHAVLLDTDLSILGAPRPRFVEYESQVRREYSWVPEEEFRKARGTILARFLERPRIYATDYFANLLESQARSNLQYSLARLAA